MNNISYKLGYILIRKDNLREDSSSNYYHSKRLLNQRIYDGEGYVDILRMPQRYSKHGG